MRNSFTNKIVCSFIIIICVIGVCAVAVQYVVQLWNQAEVIKNLESQQEQLRLDKAEAEEQLKNCQKVNEDLNEELTTTVNECSNLQYELELWEGTKEEGNQFFYGDWLIQQEAGENECYQSLTLQKDYISIDGKQIVGNPTYYYYMRVDWDIWDSLTEMGYDKAQIEALFFEKYYLEIVINNELGNAFINNAKLFLMDENQMLCFTENDGIIELRKAENAECVRNGE